MENEVQFKKVLAPLDGSELAEQILPYARRLAEACDLSVELLRVNDPETMTPHAPALADDEYLRRTAQKYFSSTARVTTRVKLGKPAEVIVDEAQVDRCNLIAMATHGISGIRRWLLGSVASKVVQSAKNPLLIVRPAEHTDSGAAAELNTVFVPLDGSGLAERVLPYVRALAGPLKLEVQLVRVFTVPQAAYIVGNGMMPQGPAPYIDSARGEAETYLDGKVQGLQADGLEKVIATAIQGDAASEIIDVACRTEKNLIAMTTHGRSGIGRWMLGSTAERIIQHSRDPVLLIRAA